MKVDLILADDHPVLLSGIKYALELNPAINVVGVAANSTELIEVLDQKRCDILVTDYAMPEGAYGDGLGLLSFLRRRYPDLRIIVFTAVDNAAIVKSIAELGVRGVLSKTDSTAKLLTAIQAVYAGASYFPSDVESQLSSRSPGRDSARSAPKELTAREWEIVRLYVSGMSINEIAAHMHRSKQAVSSLKMNAMRKLGIERDVDLFRFAYEAGLVAAAGSLDGHTG
ncbi:LuxR family transcriptional regulator [Burkholderia stagnalis]|uniref:response regulator transcription factor n=1 Tax=Burkholderia stagnalis TaxID=1503054 RepID=UPI00075A3B06|nr:response regulator transcription factor [Burkholderia stagnalis]KVD86901.1 LuxR family transcriptional regulator [Burkholderia stagnalis]KVO62987.1 LuxR family transcriptional regulator [Burkholderia stagnalis]KVP04488.1 LuxR family transcriptional regulator [Burkholderia stagnalis]KVW90132.1 LuxR family transcriptional regulator [Burkholderia stagnalis]KWH69641.1 LuxR family transcriptional regulator [Burkholderia stagnalis]